MVALSELVEIRGGGTPSKSVKEYWDGDIPWASVKDFKSTVLSSTTDYITKLGVENSSSNIIPAGTIIIPTRMALGKVAINTLDMAINQDLKALIIRDVQKLDKNYLLRFLESKAGFIEEQGKGATVKGITLDVLREIEIPLLPLPGQKRIAAILDKADSLRRKRQHSVVLADEFLRAVFIDMFGNPIANPRGWKTGNIEEGLRSIQSGWSAKGESYPCGPNQAGVLKISAVTSGTFKPLENKYVEKSLIPENKKLIFPKKGDLLFSRANTRELVAATCIVNEDRDDVFLPDKLWLIETNSDFLLPEFLNYMIWHPKFREALTSKATGTSGSMLNISKQKFVDSEVIFPNLDLQRKFKTIYWKTQNLIDGFSSSENSLSHAIGSLNQRAFSGNL